MTLSWYILVGISLTFIVLIGIVYIDNKLRNKIKRRNKYE